MKIVQVGGTYGGGGPGATTEYIHKSLLKEGNESYVFQIESNTNDLNVVRGISSLGFLVYRALCRLGLNYSSFSFFRTRKLVRKLKKINPDIVHLRVIHNGWWNTKILLGYLAKFQKSTVITLHDMWFITGGCYHFIDERCDKYTSGCLSCPKSRKQLDCYPALTHLKFEEKNKYLSQIKSLNVIAVSKWVMNNLDNSILDGRKCEIISNAVDLNIFKPMERRPKKKKTIIGVSNFWGSAKCPKDFILLSKLISDDYQIVLVGNVPSELKQEMIDNKIVLLGSIHDRKKLAQLYSDADIFVTFSRQETFGMVIAEAACCGLKTIGYNISAIPEVVTQANGIVVEFGDVNSAWYHIERVCSRKIRLSELELHQVREHFSMERLINCHLSLYSQIYEEKKDSDWL